MVLVVISSCLTISKIFHIINSSCSCFQRYDGVITFTIERRTSLNRTLRNVTDSFTLFFYFLGLLKFDLRRFYSYRLSVLLSVYRSG